MAGTADLGEAADPVLTMGAVRVAAEPGGQVQVPVRVRNPGRIVESYRVDVVGLDPPWWQALPPEIAVLPGQEGTATVVLGPPKGTVAPERPLPFGVRVVSLVDPNRSVVEEGDLEVGRVMDLSSRMTPVTARARWRAQFRLTFVNWGNAQVRLVLKASDPDEQLGFAFSQDVVVVPVGATVVVRLKVRPRKPFLRGTPVKLPFSVVGEPPGDADRRPAPARMPMPGMVLPSTDPSRPVLDGAVDQRPVLSRGVVTGAFLVVAGLALAVGALVKLGNVSGAANLEGAPPVVAGVAAKASSAGHLAISWAAVDRAQGYRVERWDEATKSTVGTPLAVPGEATGVDYEVKEPAGTKVCVVVRAVRRGTDGDIVSDVGQAACAILPDDSLEPPTGVRATSPAPGAVLLRWDPQDGVAHRVLADGAVVADVPVGGSSVTVKVAPSAPAKCVQVAVLAVAGDRVSKVDAPGVSACVRVQPEVTPTGGATDGAGGQTGGTQTPPLSTTSTTPVALTAWAVRIGGYPAATDTAIIAQYQKRVLETGIVPAERVVVLTSADVPADPTLLPGYRIVAVTGFTDGQQAAGFCSDFAALTTGQPQPLSCTPFGTGR